MRRSEKLSQNCIWSSIKLMASTETEKSASRLRKMQKVNKRIKKIILNRLNPPLIVKILRIRIIITEIRNNLLSLKVPLLRRKFRKVLKSLPKTSQVMKKVMTLMMNCHR